MFGLSILTWIKIGALLLAVGSFAWLVDDYAYQRHALEAEEAKNETLTAALASNERALRHIQAQGAANEAATRATLDRRTAEAATLQAQLAALREIPDDPACPLPAPVRGALDLLRQP